MYVSSDGRRALGVGDNAIKRAAHKPAFKEMSYASISILILTDPSNTNISVLNQTLNVSASAILDGATGIV